MHFKAFNIYMAFHKIRLKQFSFNFYSVRDLSRGLFVGGLEINNVQCFILNCFQTGIDLHK